MKYEKANAEVVKFDNSDVITTSRGGPCTGPTHDGSIIGCWLTNANWDPGHGGEEPGPVITPDEFDAF